MLHHDFGPSNITPHPNRNKKLLGTRALLRSFTFGRNGGAPGLTLGRSGSLPTRPSPSGAKHHVLPGTGKFAFPVQVPHNVATRVAFRLLFRSARLELCLMVSPYRERNTTNKMMHVESALVDTRSSLMTI